MIWGKSQSYSQTPWRGPAHSPALGTEVTKIHLQSPDILSGELCSVRAAGRHSTWDHRWPIRAGPERAVFWTNLAREMLYLLSYVKTSRVIFEVWFSHTWAPGNHKSTWPWFIPYITFRPPFAVESLPKPEVQQRQMDNPTEWTRLHEETWPGRLFGKTIVENWAQFGSQQQK